MKTKHLQARSLKAQNKLYMYMVEWASWQTRIEKFEAEDNEDWEKDIPKSDYIYHIQREQQVVLYKIQNILNNKDLFYTKEIDIIQTLIK